MKSIREMRGAAGIEAPSGVFARMSMRAEHPGEGFLRHRGLIVASAGGAMAEVGLVTLLAPAAPGARVVAPQVTALPALAAYHDLRWLFAYSPSWLVFCAAVLVVLAARSAIDAVLLRLAWPRWREAPRFRTVFWSCAALTVLAWLLLSPAAVLAFGVAVLPFSWPFLAALPIILGIVLALSHGGALAAWWRRLPPPRTVAWLLASFLVLSAAAAAIAHLGTPAALGVTAAAGVVNARAWYGLAGAAARARPLARAAPHDVVTLWRALARGARLALRAVPLAPLCALLVLAVVAGVARLMFTGTIRLGSTAGRADAAVAAPGAAGGGAAAAGAAGAATGGQPRRPPPVPRGAVLVVEGFGSTCCNDARGLAAAEPGMVVRQFSYRGMDAAGQPLPSGAGADDLPLPELGDRIAAQLARLHERAGAPVDIVAESEGTLGVYAMLVRHPGLPVGSVVLLSPIVEPGQLSYPAAGRAGDGAVSGYALTELNHLIGGISPYGSGGAQQLISSVSEFGARYFAALSRSHGKRWLAVIPLADAITLPVCQLPAGAVVVPAFHGGLLGNPGVLRMVTSFLSGRPVDGAGEQQQRLKAAAEVLTGAAAAWRMPATRPACP